MSTKPTTTTAVAAIEERRKKINEDAKKLDLLVCERLQDISLAETEFSRALAVGRAYLDIKKELTTQMDFVVALAGQANGFKCDKDYPAEKIKQCAIDALIAGCQLTGNQWNIIGGNMYIAQLGWKRKLAITPGFKFLDVPTFKDPVDGKGYVRIECSQKYSMDGKEDKYEFTAIVRTNGGSNIDNNIGKAKAKLWHALYEKLTGESWAQPGDLDPNETAGKPKQTLTIAEVIQDEGPERKKSGQWNESDVDEPGEAVVPGGALFDEPKDGKPLRNAASM